MYKWIFALVMSGAALAAPRTHQKFWVDLNGDGRPEQVLLQTYALEGVEKGQLKVLSAAGKVLWTSPRVKTPYEESPWSFLGEFDRGDLCFVDDYNGDGRVDLVATGQKSDVRPTLFKIYHWDGRRFVFEREAMLVAAPQKPGTFPWTRYDPGASSWIDTLQRTAPGRYQASLCKIPHPSQQLKLRYQAGEGFVVSE